jgi:hypothetical protein
MRRNQKGESRATGHSTAFFSQLFRLKGEHRQQCGAVEEGSYMAKNHMTRLRD